MLLRCFIYLCFLALTLDAGARASRWKPVACPGAYRLELAELSGVVLPKNAGTRLTAAAEDLAALAEKTGGTLQLREDGRPKQSIVCEILDSKTDAWKGGSGALASVGSFSIFRERTRVFVRASTEEGLANGLYAIMGEWYGARWYWQAVLGFEFADEPVDKVPEGLWRERPAFVQRRLVPSHGDWGRRNRLVGGYSFNHNLARLFNPGLYAKEPEVFPLIKGKRVEPSGNRGTDAQPDFTNPRAVEIAAEAAIAHFEENPESASFSLSINDNVRFDESEWTELVVSPVHYFRQRPDYTNLVFGFMNSVAERLDAYDAYDAKRKAESGSRKADVAQQRGDGESERFALCDAKGSESGCPSGERGAKWNRLRSASFAGQKVENERRSIWETPDGQPRYLTALSYYWTEQSPVMPIHPRVMPVLTSDRAQWHDPNYREEDRALIGRWSDSGAERIATWDYYFGSPYPYPRQFNQWIGESIEYLHAQGVDVFFSQLPSAWGLDGAKAWLTAQLLWNPEQDTTALLREFYTNFFGPASEPMRAFYELAEAHRNANEGKADWIKFYKDEAGIEMMLPVLPEMRECLEAATSLVAADSRYAARIEVVSDAFHFTERYASYYERRLALLKACLKGGAVETRVDDYLTARERFRAYSKELVQDPMHARLSAFNQLGQSDPMHLAITQMADAPAAERYRELWELMKRYGEIGGDSVLGNVELKHADVHWRKQSFLGPALPKVDDWWFSFRPYEHFKVEASLGSSRQGVRMSGADMCSLFTEVDVVPGQGYVFEFDADYRVSPDNRAHLIVYWYDSEGTNLETVIPMQFPNGQADEPIQVRVPLLAPESAARLRISFLVSRQYAGDFLDIRRVELLKVN